MLIVSVYKDNIHKPLGFPSILYVYVSDLLFDLTWDWAPQAKNNRVLNDLTAWAVCENTAWAQLVSLYKDSYTHILYTDTVAIPME